MRFGSKSVPAVAVVAIAAALAAPGSALGAKQVANKGGVRAVLSYQETDQFFNFKNVRLKIEHGGEVVYRHEFKPICDGCGLAPAGYGDAKAIRVRNLDKSKAPEVLTDFYTGGAHCCSYSVAFHRNQETYERARHNWLDSGYRLNDRDGDRIPEFRSADARFAYKYDCFACSRFPVQVYRFRGGKFVDSTGKFRALVRRDARDLRRQYRAERGKGNVRVILAAYVADQCNLDGCGDGFRLVRRALAKGYLDKQRRSDSFKPYGKAYVRSLKRFLRKLGYR